MRLKKLLSVVMAVAVLTAIMPLKAFMAFAELVPYSGICGDDLTWKFDPPSATLTISGTGNMNNYINAPWYPHCKDIETIIIGAGVIGIGTDAFSGCTGLTRITIPSGVQHIGAGILKDCINLESIIVDEGNLVYNSTENCLIKTETKNLIAGCKKSIIPTDGSVRSIECSAFSGCTGLNSIIIPNGVMSIGAGAFKGCKKLTSVTIPDSVTSIGDSAFGGCTGLTNVTIPDSVISIGVSAFDNTAWYNNHPDGLVYAGKVAYEYKGKCPSKVIIKEGARYIRPELFLNCTDLVSITIPHSVVSIGAGAFKGCKKLTSITIPDSVTSIGYDVFRDCTGLTSAALGNSVTQIDTGAFEGCTSLTSIIIPNSVVSIGNSAFEDCSDLKSVKMGNSIISIGSLAFYNCAKLESIIIPDSVIEIGCRAFEETKYYNDKSNWESGALYICRHLIRINSDVVRGNYVIKYGTKSIAYAACGSSPDNPYYYPELTSITIPNTIVAIGTYAFFGCSGLNRVIIPDSVTTIGKGAFAGCSGLKHITIPDSVTRTGESAFEDTAYYNNKSNWDNGVLYIDDHLIEAKVETIREDYKIKYGTKTIADSAFYYDLSYAYMNENLGPASIIIPNTVTSIGQYAFAGCRGMKSISIPLSITLIDQYAFFGCDNLKDVYYAGNETQKAKIAIDNSGEKALFLASVEDENEVSGNYYLINANWHYDVLNLDSEMESKANLDQSTTGSKSKKQFQIDIVIYSTIISVMAFAIYIMCQLHKRRKRVKKQITKVPVKVSRRLNDIDLFK